MTTLLRRELGDVLRERRRAQGRTLREVSATASVSLGYLSEVERGEKEASSELLASICGALELPLSRSSSTSRAAWPSARAWPRPWRCPCPRTTSWRPLLPDPLAFQGAHAPSSASTPVSPPSPRRRLGPGPALSRCGSATCRPHWWSHRPDAPHYAASTMKLPLVIAATAASCAASWTSTRRSRCATRSRRCSTVRLRHGRETTTRTRRPGPPSAAAGRCAELAEHAITHSGNLATNLLLDVVGLDEVAQVLRLAGCSPTTVVGRGIEDAVARGRGSPTP